MGLFSRRFSTKKTGSLPDPRSERKNLKREQKSEQEAENKPVTKTGDEDASHNPIKNSLEPPPLRDSALIVQKKRISTVVDDFHYEDFGKDDYDEDDLLLLDQDPLYGDGTQYYSSDENSNEDNEDYDGDYEEHTHILLERDRSHPISQLSALMGYVGLGLLESKESIQKLANEVLKRTFSLLNSSHKIPRLSPTMHPLDPRFHESVIGEKQLALVKLLKKLIDLFLDASEKGQSPYDLLENNKTLWERYGSVKDIIGRGAYGVIRIVYPDDEPAGKNPVKRPDPKKAYAVKELQKRPESSSRPSESRAQFIDRVLSEFVISSTLNNKHVVRTLDLMITIPDKLRKNSCSLYEEVRLVQVMDRTSGGDLFHYCKKLIISHEYLCIDEVDCMVKQITKGLWYMHSHGVAHCDLKLENILIESDPNSVVSVHNTKRGQLNLKISDFGKANVVRTLWDTQEQVSTSNLPIGSEPYMAPEEHIKHLKNSGSGISLLKKDCWALGVIALILFNIRRSFFYRCNGSSKCQLEFYDSWDGECSTRRYGVAYLWQTTEPKALKQGKYKDPVFEEYAEKAMLSDYNPKSKEWVVHRRGMFIPIETMFDIPQGFKDAGYDGDASAFEKDDFDLRRFCTYKLLDMNAATRLDTGALLKSDWLASVGSCGD